MTYSIRKTKQVQLTPVAYAIVRVVDFLTDDLLPQNKLMWLHNQLAGIWFYFCAEKP